MPRHVTVMCSDNIDPDGIEAAMAALHPWVRDTLNLAMVIVTGRQTRNGDMEQIHEWAARRMRGNLNCLGGKNTKVYKGHIPPFPGVPDSIHLKDELLDPHGYHRSMRPDGDFRDAKRHIAKLVKQGYTLNFIGAGPYGEMAELLDEFQPYCNLVSGQVGPYDDSVRVASGTRVGFNGKCNPEALQRVAASEVDILWNTATTTRGKEVVFWSIDSLRQLGLHPILLDLNERYVKGTKRFERGQPVAPHDVHCTISLAAALGNQHCQGVVRFEEAVTVANEHGQLDVTFGPARPGMAKRLVAVEVDSLRFKYLFGKLCGSW